METERGDAIDILAFMVDQSLSYGQLDIGSHALLCNECQDKRRATDSCTQYCCRNCFEKVKLIAESVQEIIDNESSSSEHDVSGIDRQMISDVIAALIRSHEFALEVKRSSLSARTWLNSIGCSTVESVDKYKIDCNQALDDVASRARLRSAELSIATKEGEIIRLNEELTKCRAEIGQLKSSHGAQVCFASVTFFHDLLSIIA